jgi:hypothetical protein
MENKKETKEATISSSFFRITQYNACAHNTHTNSPIRTHVHKLYSMSTSEGLGTR